MHRTCVNPGVDEELDHMKRTYDGIEDLLNKTSHAVAATIPSQFDVDLNVIFYPQIGFLICVPFNPHTGRPDYQGGVTEAERWTPVFSTENRVYFKDFRMKQLDETLGDIYAVICGIVTRPRISFWVSNSSSDREIEIVHELRQQILAEEAMLIQTSDICGMLDW